MSHTTDTAQTTSNLTSPAALQFAVDGLPPAKSEALSMLGARHPHAPRVRSLLEAALAEANAREHPGFGGHLLGLKVTLRTPGDPPSDATNYLGGVADVLEDKAHRGPLDHLGDLAGFGIYDNDRQLHEVHYHHEESRPTGYTVRVWVLGGEDR